MSSCPDIRLAQETDVPQLKTLWLRCFPEDTPADVDAFFQTVWPLADCLIALSPEAPERPASMAFLLPAEVCFSGQRLPVRYLYAGCTAPEFRGRGLYTALLDAAKTYTAAHGAYALYLHPATPELEPLYRRAGYRPEIRRANDKAYRFTANTSAPFWQPVAPIAAFFALTAGNSTGNSTVPAKPVAMWLPTAPSPALQRAMKETGGYTALLGE